MDLVLSHKALSYSDHASIQLFEMPIKPGHIENDVNDIRVHRMRKGLGQRPERHFNLPRIVTEEP